MEPEVNQNAKPYAITSTGPRKWWDFADAKEGS